MDLNTQDNLIKIANEYQTPCYVYNQQKIIDNYQSYQAGFKAQKHLICYAVKANSNLTILKILAKLGSGFDIVSIGELKRVLAAGGDPSKTVFSGVGKQDFEIKFAIESGILCFNIESVPELNLINKIAKELNKIVKISIRVNPNIDAQSHPYISTGLREHKFGINIDDALSLYNAAKQMKNLQIIGVDCHIGSQLTSLDPIKQSCLALNKLIIELLKNNIAISHINMGGGLGIDYDHLSTENSVPSQKQWIETIINNLDQSVFKIKPSILMEPGRSIIGNAGILLTKVIYNKSDSSMQHNFTVVDAAMNDLIRPALYNAAHKIINISIPKQHHSFHTSIVGPVCESSDVFLKNIKLDSSPGDILAILDTGAYGFTMSSNYNSRPRPPEVLIEPDNTLTLIRARETFEDLYKIEKL